MKTLAEGLKEILKVQKIELTLRKSTRHCEDCGRQLEEGEGLESAVCNECYWASIEEAESLREQY